MEGASFTSVTLTVTVRSVLLIVILASEARGCQYLRDQGLRRRYWSTDDAVERPMAKGVFLAGYIAVLQLSTVNVCIVFGIYFVDVCENGTGSRVFSNVGFVGAEDRCVVGIADGDDELGLDCGARPIDVGHGDGDRCIAHMVIGRYARQIGRPIEIIDEIQPVGILPFESQLVCWPIVGGYDEIVIDRVFVYIDFGLTGEHGWEVHIVYAEFKVLLK